MEWIRRLIRKVKNQSGVTLIELLAVVVILGIIAAVAVPKIINTKADAQKSVGQSDANVLTEISKRHIFEGLAYSATETDTTQYYNLTEMASEAGLTITNEAASTDSGVQGTAELDDQNGNKLGTLSIATDGKVTFAQ